jgi:RES domain-containing protein
VLRVPSAVLPIEDNLLLNPSHPQIARIKVVAQQAFAFDRRLLG